MDILTTLCKELNISPAHCQNVLNLIDEGNTIPFIARYRKEMTGSMDDEVLRTLYERLEYLRNMEAKRAEILSAIDKQGLLSEELTRQIQSAQTLTELEDLYRPYRPKRRTRATIAKEKGLEPLALRLLLQNEKKTLPEQMAEEFLSEELGVLTTQEALQGARDILAEMISDDAAARKTLREQAQRSGIMECVRSGENESVYETYYDFKQAVRGLPGHRILAINRGEKEGFLKVSLKVDEAERLSLLCNAFVREGSTTSEHVRIACEDGLSRLIAPSIETEVRRELTDNASAAAVQLFGKNLHQLLMTPPIKGHVTLGVDPGFRTGCKLAVVDAGGKVLETGIGHFTLPGQETAKMRAAQDIVAMCKRHGVTAVAIGNGTASREAEQFIASILPQLQEGAFYMIVSEAGASVYSASKVAAQEFPDYDVTLRSAISIARRMQDPLAELVKTDPKALGIGQYQHDLKEGDLATALEGVVEGCVNTVGVEISTASAPLLSHVAGIGPQLAKNIVAFREENGITSRAQLKKVPRLGAKAFEQCAGFIRVADSKNVLDRTAVHPESYDAASALLKVLSYETKDMKQGRFADIKERATAFGLDALCKQLEIGLPTLSDILLELARPGRDVRDDLPRPLLRKDVLDMKDLKPGMELSGTVRNLTDFGAFIDIGVHQDGLAHISRISNRFIRHPSDVLKVSQVVKCWVVEVDAVKKRIALTLLAP